MESGGARPGNDSHATTGDWVASMDLKRDSNKDGGASTTATCAMSNCGIPNAVPAGSSGQSL